MPKNIIQLAESFCQFTQDKFETTSFIPLHVPTLTGNEEAYVTEAIRSTFVSTVGQKVVDFESDMARYLGVEHAVAMVNGTAALHIALLAVGVKPESEVITQPLSFVATANAISYCNAEPIFIDIDENNMSLCPQALMQWLENNVKVVDGKAFNVYTKKHISACVPMHTFGFIGEIEQIIAICKEYGIPVVEDAAESLGSKKIAHAGTFGDCAAISFNGNKIMTTGGGGMLITNDEHIANMARHLSTTAKVPHKWEYVHDVIGFNYRMPNLNAALGVAQLEQLPRFLDAKRQLASSYQSFFSNSPVMFVTEPAGNQANYWLCTIKLESKSHRDEFLKITNDSGVMTRPAWQLLNQLPGFQHCQTGTLQNAEQLVERLVNIPSSVITSN